MRVRGGFLFFIFVFLTLLVPSSPVAGGAAATGAQGQMLGVESLRLGTNAGKTRIVLDLSRPTTFRTFLMDGPPRVVLDLPRAKINMSRTRYINDSPVLKSYRSGDLEEGLTRFIFDLSQPAVVASAFLLPKTGTQHDRLVIDLKPENVHVFRAQLQEVQGQRHLSGLKPATLPPQRSERVKSDIKTARPPEEDHAGNTPLPLRKPLQPKGLKVAKSLPAEDIAEKHTIIIDAGHGGHDPGAIGHGGVREKNITLSTAKTLKKLLEETGRYKVYLTRSDDRFIELRERVNFSRRKQGDLFISIHADKIARKDVRGASLYTLSEKASDSETARLAEQENKAGMVSGVDLSGESADVADILLDLAMREKMNESNLLARFIQSAFKRNGIRLLPNSHRSAGFAVLKAPDIPSILIEIGFLSNTQEAKLLSSSAFQRDVAKGIVEGVDAYFRKIEALRKI